MLIREASIDDIPELHAIRLSVKENQLSNPAVVTASDYRKYLLHRGRAWLCELAGGQIAGFAIVDLQGHNVWALFVHPNHEGEGIGRILHDAMLDWYFAKTNHPIWLSTAPGTRAARFYERAGWECTGLMPNGELHFQLQAAKTV